MAEKRFVIPVERRWTLLILPILALLYFLAVVTLAALDRTIEGLGTETLVLIGAGLFGLVLLVELPFLFKKTVRIDDDQAAVLGATPVEAVPAYAPAPARVERDDEARGTNETAQGMKVIEYSRPAKSRNRGSVYAKTMVPVTKEHVLRVETLAAEPREL